ncbi:hypothetical protein VP01_650g1 [Puccinia sorghi]|uniref:Uncharacterized protein n=1 Tax=Puccinia sorghi TaxID=27349 RepID=A0A0L6UFJ4_9BASI|nr:hypothetical protein VP01_650g1 [Puccinia sorghi]
MSQLISMVLMVPCKCDHSEDKVVYLSGYIGSTFEKIKIIHIHTLNTILVLKLMRFDGCVRDSFHFESINIFVFWNQQVLNCNIVRGIGARWERIDLCVSIEIHDRVLRSEEGEVEEKGRRSGRKRTEGEMRCLPRQDKRSLLFGGRGDQLKANVIIGIQKAIWIVPTWGLLLSGNSEYRYSRFPSSSTLWSAQCKKCSATRGAHLQERDFTTTSPMVRLFHTSRVLANLHSLQAHEVSFCLISCVLVFSIDLGRKKILHHYFIPSEHHFSFLRLISLHTPNLKTIDLLKVTKPSCHIKQLWDQPSKRLGPLGQGFLLRALCLIPKGRLGRGAGGGGSSASAHGELYSKKEVAAMTKGDIQWLRSHQHLITGNLTTAFRQMIFNGNAKEERPDYGHPVWSLYRRGGNCGSQQ